MSADPGYAEVSLTFRGFSANPEEIESFVGVRATRSGRKGCPVAPRVKSILRRSYVLYRVDFGGRFDEMIPSLIAHVGGAATIARVRERFAPEFVELDILFSVRGNDKVVGGEIERASLQEIIELGCSFSIGFR